MNARLLRSLTVVGALASAAALADEKSVTDATVQERVIRTAQGFSSERAADELRDPLRMKESRTRVDRLITKSKAGSAEIVESAAFGDSWVYEASTELFYDVDRDGYFHYLRVQFDADTVFDEMFIYAEIYLSADGSSWEHLFSTDNFAIWGSDPDDDYEVETELVSGYSTGQYDVLIELYDADTGELLDEFGPMESSALSLLPLEDSTRDGADLPPDSDSYDGGGGAMSWPMLLGLLTAGVVVRRRAAGGRAH